ncbi:MAG TPA: DUF2194 domain-containing protein [Trichococcus sp.]|nr:DUF2194 domain-containing protein [Trichococcus sp.]
MTNHEIKFAKTLMIVTIFTAIILIFQLSRMGILDNSEYDQTAKEESVPAVEKLEESTIQKDAPMIGILTDAGNPNEKYLLDGVAQYLEHLDYQYEYINLSKVSDMEQYDMLIVFLTGFDEGQYMNAVMEYVRSGKFAYFPYLPFEQNSFSSNLRKLGVIESNYEDFSIKQIQDSGGVFGEANETYDIPRTVNLSIKLRLAEECEMLLESEGNPLLWSMDYGEGTFLVSSSDFLASSESRGVLAYALYQGLFQPNDKAMVQPFYNVSTTVLQDIVLPDKINDSHILSQTGVDQDSFTLNHYFKLFKDISESYGDKISMSYTVDYSELFNEKLPETLQKSQFRLYTSQILGMGGDILSGGYSNHPLGLKNELEQIGYFIPWKNKEQMKESIEVAKSYLDDVYKGYPLSSYIPPQGRIGQESLSRIDDLFPDVETVINRYVIEYPDQLLGDFTTLNNGNQYLYTITTENGAAQWGTMNAIGSLGISSFGFHSQRLYTDSIDFQDFTADVQRAYELEQAYSLEKKTPGQAAKMVEQYQNMTFNYAQDAQGLEYEIDFFVEGSAFMLRSEKTPVSDDAKIKSIGNYHIIYPDSSKGYIRWKEPS